METGETAKGTESGAPGRSLVRLFWEWFKISLFVIGGGYAIIVAADSVFGRRLKWLREGELIERLPIFQTIPGLIAGNSAVYVGLKIGGIPGALISLIAVALPSFAIILAFCYGFSWLPLENRFVAGAFLGLRCALTALIAVTVLRSGKRVLHGVYPWVAAPLSLLLLDAAHVNPALVLIGAMLCGIAIELLSKNASEGNRGVCDGEDKSDDSLKGPFCFKALTIAAIAACALRALSSFFFSIFATFAKFGMLCFGGGYVLVPLYIDEFIRKASLLTYEHFGNLLSVTQATPGPVSVNAATFFGFLLGERAGFAIAAPIGSAIATIGLLMPSFFLLIAALRSLANFRESRIVRGLLRGVAPATIGLMISALLVFMSLSVFTGQIPWRALLGLHCPPEFGIRPGAVVLVALASFAFSKRPGRVVALILSCAAIGAIVFPFTGG